MRIVMNAAVRHRPAPAAWRELVRLVLASVATGAAVSIVLAVAVFLVATEANATSLPPHGPAIRSAAAPGAERPLAPASPAGTLAGSDAYPV